MKKKRILLLLSCMVCSLYSLAQEPEPITQITDSSTYKLHKLRKQFWDSLPKPIGWTNDLENIYSPAEEMILDSIISVFEKETSIEISIVTLDSTLTSVELFNDLALHIARTWGIGKKDKDNGILICISTGHRRIRISNGYGIEQMLTDEETNALLNRYILPKFKRTQFFQGTYDGLIALIKKLKDKSGIVQ